jgi:hypothetical protein
MAVFLSSHRTHTRTLLVVAVWVFCSLELNSSAAACSTAACLEAAFTASADGLEPLFAVVPFAPGNCGPADDYNCASLPANGGGPQLFNMDLVTPAVRTATFRHGRGRGSRSPSRLRSSLIAS